MLMRRPEDAPVCKCLKVMKREKHVKDHVCSFSLSMAQQVLQSEYSYRSFVHAL